MDSIAERSRAKRFARRDDPEPFQLTDRDLTHTLLAQIGSEIGFVQVMTQSMEQVFKGADETMNRYAAVLKSDGASLVDTFRSGHTPDASFDAWLGRLADCWGSRTPSH